MIFLKACTDVAQGITDEDYDLFYEIWQEFDPNGTQYIKYENLTEFLDVLEKPLQISKPNKYKIIQLDVPIVKFTNPRDGEVMNECIFSADILDILTQDFFTRNGNSIMDDHNNSHVEEVKVIQEKLSSLRLPLEYLQYLQYPSVPLVPSVSSITSVPYVPSVPL
jgi:hypothetical protein